MPATAPPRSKYPRVHTLQTFDPRGVRFHVASDNENHRVSHAGGEQEYTRAILDELRPGEILFDVGACVGMIAIHARLRGATVFAFEPDPAFVLRLRENISLNDLEHDHRLRVLPLAVGAGPGRTTLFSDGIDGLAPSLRSGRVSRPLEVEIDSIDHLIARRVVPIPDAIKLDIEGAELLAVQGMLQLLQSGDRPRVIFLELHPDFLPAFGGTTDDVIRPIEAAGFQLLEQTRRDDQEHRIYRRDLRTTGRFKPVDRRDR